MRASWSPASIRHRPGFGSDDSLFTHRGQVNMLVAPQRASGSEAAGAHRAPSAYFESGGQRRSGIPRAADARNRVGAGVLPGDRCTGLAGGSKSRPV